MKQIRIAVAALFVIPIFILSLLYAFLPAALLRGERGRQVDLRQPDPPVL